MTFDNPFMTKQRGGEEFSADLTGIDASGARLPIGRWEAELIDIETAVSAAGNPMWVWTFVVASGDPIGKTGKLYTALQADALWKLAQTAEALGLGESNKPLSFKREDALGRRCVLDVTEQEYKGKPTTGINSVLPHPSGVGYRATAAVTQSGLPLPR